MARIGSDINISPDDDGSDDSSSDGGGGGGSDPVPNVDPSELYNNLPDPEPEPDPAPDPTPSVGDAVDSGVDDVQDTTSGSSTESSPSTPEPEPDPAPSPEQQVQEQITGAAPEPADTSVNEAAEQVVDSAPTPPTEDTSTTTQTPDEQVQEQITGAAPEPADTSVNEAAEQVVDSAPTPPTEDTSTTTQTPDEQVQEQITGAAPEPTDLPARGRGHEGSGPRSTAPDPEPVTETDPQPSQQQTSKAPAPPEPPSREPVQVPKDAPTESRATNPTTNIQMTAAPQTSGPADRAMQQSGDGLIAAGIGSVGGLIGGSSVGQAVLGPSGQTENYVRGKFTGLGEFSGDVATGAEKQIVNPAADIAGQGVAEVNTLLTRPDLLQESTQTGTVETDKDVEQTATKYTGGIGSVGTDIIRAPQTAVGAANVVGSQTNVGLRNVKQEGVSEGTAKSVSNLGGTAVNVGGAFAGYAQENPAETLGMLTGSVLASGLSPVRLTKRRVPTGKRTDVDLETGTQAAARGMDADVDATRTVMESTGTTTARGLRVQSPWLLEQAGMRVRGRTIAGTLDGRPTTGAPSLAKSADELDLSRMGATGTGTFEPGSAFEADIVRSTAGDVGDAASARFRTAESIQTRAQLRRRSGFTADTAEDAVGEARAVPDSAVGEVTDALRDTDATVFGSAAARAQLDDFRQPRDLDIVVSDKSAAKTRLSESLEGEDATVGDVFDIKEVEDVPGRARGGEHIKFGRTSRTPKKLDGVPFNPVEEELVRKSGASAFLRQPGAGGTADLDIGPEPRRPGRPDVRKKDPTDTAMMADELGVSSRRVRSFERAYDLLDDAPDASSGGLLGSAGKRLRVGEFADDVRGQAGAGGLFTRRADVDADRPRGDFDGEDAGRRVTNRDGDSPGTTTPQQGTPAASPQTTATDSPTMGGSSPPSPSPTNTPANNVPTIAPPGGDSPPEESTANITPPPDGDPPPDESSVPITPPPGGGSPPDDATDPSILPPGGGSPPDDPDPYTPPPGGGSPPDDPDPYTPPPGGGSPPDDPDPYTPPPGGGSPPDDPDPYTPPPGGGSPRGPDDGDDRWYRDEPDSSPDTGVGALESSLGSGWYNEFISAQAGISRQAPDQERLEEAAGGRQITALPTEGELQSEQEFDRALGFFTGEGTAVDAGFDFGDDGEGLL